MDTMLSARLARFHQETTEVIPAHNMPQLFECAGEAITAPGADWVMRGEGQVYRVYDAETVLALNGELYTRHSKHYWMPVKGTPLEAEIEADLPHEKHMKGGLYSHRWYTRGFPDKMTDGFYYWMREEDYRRANMASYAKAASFVPHTFSPLYMLVDRYPRNKRAELRDYLRNALGANGWESGSGRGDLYGVMFLRHPENFRSERFLVTRYDLGLSWPVTGKNP